MQDYQFVGSVTFILIVINSVVSLAALYFDPRIIDRGYLKPFRVVRENTWYELLTSGFLHANFTHLFVNMFTLYFFGQVMERVIGPFYFTGLFISGLIISGLPCVLKFKDNPNYAALGASGAVAGLLFSAILYFPDMSLYVMFIPIPIPAPLFAILYLVYCWYAGKKAQDNINHDAHMWGALSGVLLTVLLDFSTVKGLFQLIF